jgi:hypothetical protein
MHAGPVVAIARPCGGPKEVCLPFSPPFRAAYVKNDLVYGLAGARGLWMMEHVPGFSTQIFASQPTIDVLEREIEKVDQVTEWNAQFIEHLNQHPK